MTKIASKNIISTQAREKIVSWKSNHVTGVYCFLSSTWDLISKSIYGHPRFNCNVEIFNHMLELEFLLHKMHWPISINIQFSHFILIPQEYKSSFKQTKKQTRADIQMLNPENKTCQYFSNFKLKLNFSFEVCIWEKIYSSFWLEYWKILAHSHFFLLVYSLTIDLKDFGIISKKRVNVPLKTLNQILLKEEGRKAS